MCVLSTTGSREGATNGDGRVMDADVIIVGAAPTGLMLASELCLAGVRPLVLERLPQVRAIPKAGGLSGQILQLLRYRGLLERFEAASAAPARLPDSRLAVCTLTSRTSQNPQCRRCTSLNRYSSVCSRNTPANAAPTSVANTRSSG